MEKGYLEFCRTYKQPKIEQYHIQFFLSVSVIGKKVLSDVKSANDLFQLDQEDLDYLYAKYSKRLNEEMEKNIQEVRDQYKTEKA